MSYLPTLSDLSEHISVIDEIYSTWSRPCTVYMNPTITACNCQNTPDNGPQAAWISGGPAYQFNPSCPLCSGSGKVTQEHFSTIKLILEFNPSKFDPVWKSQLTRISKGVVQAKGFLTDLPTIIKCIYMRTDLQGYSDYKFTLAAEPVSIEKIIQGRYFTSIWERA